MFEISVIVPLYKGKKYINSIIDQIERACQKISSKSVELLLVNDFPDEIIDDIDSEILSIKVINSEVNRGIHGARVYGLNFAQGKYVHFLDQDDEISPMFYMSQLMTIGDADVTYCRAYSDWTEIYNTDSVFEQSNKRENFFVRVPMMSPGQALVKKESIPTIWREQILKNSGCDDYMLWLCMLGNNNTFVLNDNKLYRHRSTSVNLSSDMYAAYLSDREMSEVLLKNNIFTGKEREQVANIPMNQFKRKNFVQMKARTTLLLIDLFERLEEKKMGLVKYLKDNNINRFIIYGYGDFGKHIKRRLCSEGLECIYLIDKNAEYIQTNVPIGTLEQCNKFEDVILVTVVTDCENILTNLKNNNFKKVINVKELLMKLDEENNPFIWE